MTIQCQGNCYKREHDGNTLYNSYYQVHVMMTSVSPLVTDPDTQWVAIFLVIQAMVFYLPRVLWLSVEGGLMKVRTGSPLPVWRPSSEGSLSCSRPLLR